MTAQPGLVVIYRWQIAAKHIEAFRARWSKETRRLMDRGGMGSLLAQSGDGLYYAIALWPDLATREAAFSLTPPDEPWPPATALKPVVLTTLENHWS